MITDPEANAPRSSRSAHRSPIRRLTALKVRRSLSPPWSRAPPDHQPTRRFCPGRTHVATRGHPKYRSNRIARYVPSHWPQRSATSASAAWMLTSASVDLVVDSEPLLWRRSATPRLGLVSRRPRGQQADASVEAKASGAENLCRCGRKRGVSCRPRRAGTKAAQFRPSQQSGRGTRRAPVVGEAGARLLAGHRRTS